MLAITRHIASGGVAEGFANRGAQGAMRRPVILSEADGPLLRVGVSMRQALSPLAIVFTSIATFTLEGASIDLVENVLATTLDYRDKTTRATF